MGQYDRFQDLDLAKKPITDITQLKMLFDEPVLLLIDEIPHYLLKADSEKIGNRTLADLTIGFVMDLISAVSASPRSCLVMTLTDRQKLYESYVQKISSGIKTMRDYRTDDVLDFLGEGISRQSKMITPVNRDQIYDVVRTRLVQGIDCSERDKIVQEYYRYYEERGLASHDIKEKLTKSYPFHPSLIDTLYDRVSTIPEFNQTRGMLRLLARVIRQIEADKPDCSLIGLPNVPLSISEIADDLTVGLGRNLRVVIDADCVAHAREADRQKQNKIVEAIARSVFVFSLHGSTKKSGMSRSAIKMAVGFPGLDPSLVDKALDDILENFWYIRDKDVQEFYFVESPNINAIIQEHKNEITPNEVKDEIKKSLHDILPQDGFHPILWNEDNLEDDGRLRLLVVDYTIHLSDDDAIKRYVSNILDRTSRDKIRTHKNTLAFVLADQNTVSILENQAKTLAAIKKTTKDERIHADKSFLKLIKSKESSAQAQMRSDCMTAYCRVAYPHGPEPRLDTIRFGESKMETITGAVTELLEKKGKLIRNIGSDGVEIPSDIKKISDIYNSFQRDKQKPFVLNTASFAAAIKAGTQSGKFGFCQNVETRDDKYIADIGKECFDWDGHIVNKNLVYTEEPEKDIPESRSPKESPVNKFVYRIYFADFSTTWKFVNNLTLLNLENTWKSAAKRFQIDITIGDSDIAIKSTARDIAILKGFLKTAMSSGHPSGSCSVEITSEESLDEFFAENEIEADAA